MPNCTRCGAPTDWEGDDPALCTRCFDDKVDRDAANKINAANKVSRERRKASVAAYQHEYWLRRKGAQG